MELNLEGYKGLLVVGDVSYSTLTLPFTAFPNNHITCNWVIYWITDQTLEPCY